MDSKKRQAKFENTLPLTVRQDIQIERQNYGGEIFYAAKDPLTLRYYRMKELEYFIFTLLDGSREVQDIQAEVEKKFNGLKVSEAQIKEFIVALRNNNFLETFGTHSYNILYRRVNLKKWAKIKQTLMSFFFIKIPLVDPDRFLNRIYPYFKFLCTKAFFFVWLFFLALFLFIVLGNYKEFFYQITGFFNMKNLALVWVAVMVIKTLHEVGHSLVCKHYGGEVHELGILLIVFTPWMYTNVSDAWIFQKSRQRFLVTVAGLMTELLVASFAAIVWWITQPGLLNSLCHNIVVVCSVDNIIRNANPLLRYDGYYALGDFLETPNLRVKTNGYLKLLLKKHLLRLPISDSDPAIEQSPRRRLIYLIYGPLSFLYLNFIILAIAGFIAQKFFFIGLILAASMLFRSFILPVQKGVAFAFKNRGQMGYGRPFFIAAALLPAAILLFLLFYKSPSEVASSCSVEPAEHNIVRSKAAGDLEKLFCRQGDRVKKGQVLAFLKNQEMMKDYEKLQITRESLLQAKVKALGLDQYSEYDQAELGIKKIEKDIEKLKEKVEKLKILAPSDGIILTPNLEERIGNFFTEGEAFCEMGHLDKVSVRVIIPEADFSEVRKGNRVDLKVYSYAEKLFRGEVTEVSSAKIEQLENPALSSKFGGNLPTETVSKMGEVPKLPYFQVTMKIDNSGGLLRPGMTGVSIIYGEKKTLIVLIWHKILRLIKPDKLLIFSS